MGNDPACYEFEPATLDGLALALGRAVRPDLSPEQCPAHWATLPFVDCTDRALLLYAAKTAARRLPR